MVVVAVDRQAVAADEVVAVAVAVPVFGTDVIVADSLLQTVCIQNNVFVRVGAVARIKV